jgi:flavorubredoxin
MDDGLPITDMLRHITQDLYQIGECVAGQAGHEAVRVYVLLNNGRPILIDCGSHLHRAALLRELDRLLNGTAPQFIFLTHSELPHSGNLQKIAEKWPKIQVLVSNVLLPYIELAPVLPLGQITAVTPGAILEFAGRRLEFVDALLKDQPGSQWLYDSLTKTLFTGDGFGYYHPPDQCELFSDEVAGGIMSEQFRPYHYNAFRFLRWVIPERLNADMDTLFQQRDVQIIAPIHGNAIRDVPLHVGRLQTAINEICTPYRKEAIDWRVVNL